MVQEMRLVLVAVAEPNCSVKVVPLNFELITLVALRNRARSFLLHLGNLIHLVSIEDDHVSHKAPKVA